jgi:hypothetical protein
MSVFDNNGITAWGQLQKALEDVFGGFGNSQDTIIQTSAIARRAEWDTQNPLLNLYYQQLAADQIPDWGPLYNQTGRWVSDEYATFMDLVSNGIREPLSPQAKARLEGYQAEVRAAQADLLRFERQLRADWTEYLNSTTAPRPLSRNQWEELLGYSAIRQQNINRVDLANGAYLSEMNANGGAFQELGRAQSAYGGPNAKIALPSNELFARDEYRDTWDLKFRQQVEGDLIRFKQDPPNQFEFQIESGRTVTTTFENRWSGSASFGAGWFWWSAGFGGNADHTSIRRDHEDKTAQMLVRFKNLQEFPITRGSWFKMGLVRSYGQQVRQANANWVKGARLNIIPQSLIIGTGLEVEINTSDTTSHYSYDAWNSGGSGGFRIGPFSFGGGGSSSTVNERTEVTKTGTKLKVKDTSDRAIIVAVKSIRPVDLL